MAFRFLHAADLHLDTPFHGLGQAQPEIARALRDASLDALDALVDTAIAEDCELVLVAGDLYDGAERGLRAQLHLLRAAERLSAAGITTCIVHGNHDPVEQGWSAVHAWPERFHVLGTAQVETVAVTARDGTPIRVHGISFPRREQRESLVARFPKVGRDAFHIGLLHASVGAQPDHAPYSPCALDDLVATGHHYWALGHIHRQQVLRTDPHVVYPGNLQGRSFKPSEQGAKGAVLVTVDGDQVTTAPVALDRVRFVEVELDVSEAGDVPGVLALLDEVTERLADEHEGRGLLLRARLVGSGGPADDLLRAGSAEVLLDQLRRQHAGRTPFVWWARLDLDVTPDLDLDALRDGDDLAASLIRLSEELESERLPALDDLLDRGAQEGLTPDILDALRPLALRDALIRLRS